MPASKPRRRGLQLRAGLALLAAVLLFAALGPWLAPHRFDALVGTPFAPASTAAPLGYDALGRDVWSRLLAGGGSLIWMSLASAALPLVVGTPLGLIAGYARRGIDPLIVWLTDLLLAFPEVILVLLVVSMLGRSRWIIALTVAVAFLPSVVRLARALTLRMAGQEFVEAARLFGFSGPRILLREILPNIAIPLLVQFGIMLTWATALLSALSFLGYGVEAPAADWGLMISENRSGLLAQPLSVLAPIGLIVLFAIGANLFAEGLGQALHPGDEANA